MTDELIEIRLIKRSTLVEMDWADGCTTRLTAASAPPEVDITDMLDVREVRREPD